MLWKRLSITAALLTAVGCSTDKQQYTITVQNHMAQPVTLWLTKTSGPQQQGWAAPEDLGMRTPELDGDPLPDVVLPAGKTAHIGPLAGTLAKDQGRAYLRVYAGTPSLGQMLATDRASMSRLDLLVKPGLNQFDLDDRTGFLGASRLDPTPPASTH